MDPQYFKSHTMCWGTLGTVRPFSNFHPQKDVIQIHQALEKKDVATLVSVLTNRNNVQRRIIAEAFQGATEQDLVDLMKKCMSGDLEALMLELMMPPMQHNAHRLRQAMAGLGTDEETLLEILCTRSSKELRDISAVYTEMYERDLEKDLKAETSGDFAKLVVALVKKDVIKGFVQRDIESLAASLNEKKADAAPWIDILTSRDSNHLKKVLKGLELESGQILIPVLEKRFSGDIRLGLSVLVACIQNPDAYLAKRLSRMKAPVVHGVMVSHSEEDLLCIRVAFLKLTGTSLYTTLQKHFNGDHLEALLAICRSED
ncbi:annexin A2 [Corythoichthys intestinalis]|uniref:annexin A2 n=1 Tax=Corythoichthys intestinalis TaxID=161448 RepID=UPI0025A668CB|nr:annexin A2 [Corythoichthys intestinalis]XP_061809023.1 annexin A2-like [Nerophis lumbriciformis]